MQTKWDHIIQRIAVENHTTPEQVRREMLDAIREGQKSKDSFIRARWNAIPRKGTELTLEEFLDYLTHAASRGL